MSMTFTERVRLQTTFQTRSLLRMSQISNCTIFWKYLLKIRIPADWKVNSWRIWTAVLINKNFILKESTKDIYPRLDEHLLTGLKIYKTFFFETKQWSRYALWMEPTCDVFWCYRIIIKWLPLSLARSQSIRGNSPIINCMMFLLQQELKEKIEKEKPWNT